MEIIKEVVYPSITYACFITISISNYHLRLLINFPRSLQNLGEHVNIVQAVKNVLRSIYRKKNKTLHCPEWTLTQNLEIFSKFNTVNKSNVEVLKSALHIIMSLIFFVFSKHRLPQAFYIMGVELYILYTKSLAPPKHIV